MIAAKKSCFKLIWRTFGKSELVPIFCFAIKPGAPSDKKNGAAEMIKRCSPEEALCYTEIN